MPVINPLESARNRTPSSMPRFCASGSIWSNVSGKAVSGQIVQWRHTIAAAVVKDHDTSTSRLPAMSRIPRSEEHTSELQSRVELVCRLLLEKKNNKNKSHGEY